MLKWKHPCYNAGGGEGKAEMDEATNTRAVLICGPTSSGKSALAVELAREFGGVIINADLMQVYAELRIITNRPTPADEASAPHRLYGFRPAREPYSAALWLADVRAALDEAKGRGQPPVIVGGTGLYFKALTEGLSEIPDIPDEISRPHPASRADGAAASTARRACPPRPTHRRAPSPDRSAAHRPRARGARSHWPSSCRMARQEAAAALTARPGLPSRDER